MNESPSYPRALPDEVARRRIEEDLRTSLFVEAAAGTGKTTALISRIVALLRTGTTTLDRIVAVTFTDRAAGEMKLGLREEVERLRGAAETPPEERGRLQAALEHLELARINTIHGFCAELLGERPLESGVDPLFRIVAEDESQAILEAAFESWFQTVISDPPEGVRRVLSRARDGLGNGGPREMLRAAAKSLLEHRDYPAAWRRQPFDRDAAIDEAIQHLAQAAELAGRAERADDWLAKSFREIARFVDEVRLQRSIRGLDHDVIEARLRAFAGGRNRHWRWTGGKRPYAPDVSRKQALAVRDGVKAELERTLAAGNADLASLLREELREVVAAYEAIKERTGKLDFIDLLIRARDLLRGSSEVRRELQSRYTHFFVDEFQDTDPLQVDILLLLTSADPDQVDVREVRPVPGKLFIVGDPKQSIYRFRRADIAVYEGAKQQLVAAGAEHLHLSASFRALPPIQETVNAAFSLAMTGGREAGQADYIPLEPVRAASLDQPSTVVLPVPRPYADYGDNARMTRRAISDSFPDAVGAFVTWLIRESNWGIEEPGSGEPAPIAPRHICILFRRLQSYGDDVTRPYARALEARGVPHMLVGGRSFHEREEVLAIRNMLTAVEWPDDELRVFATLRGPFFAVGDDLLLAFRGVYRGLQPLRWLDAAEVEALDAGYREVGEALAILAHLHVERNRQPIAETIESFLSVVRAHAGLAIWPDGRQALANCYRTIDRARRFERQGASSFRAYVEYLEKEAERGTAENAPVVEEGIEGVRMMTVHRAKGLEFPVVVLVDPTCNATHRRPSRHVDPNRGLWAEPLCGCVPQDLLDAQDKELQCDAAEAVRLAYVAATRARDLLVVPGVPDADAADDVSSGWLEALNPAIYPHPDKRRAADSPSGCPSFGPDSAFERPASCPSAAEDSVRPGLHRAQAGNSVVWWDPGALTLDVEEEVGLSDQRILEAEASGSDESGAERYKRWTRAHEDSLEAGASPSLIVETFTGLSSPEKASGESPVRIDQVALNRSGRPGGTRFGVLVHRVLATIDFQADHNEVEAQSRAQGRTLGASEEEIHAATEAIDAALRHDVLERAAAAAARSDLRRETPTLLRLDDGSIAEGVIDLAFREETADGSTWTVVDFKTDRGLGASRARYEAQVHLAVCAVTETTGEPAQGVLLIV